MLKGSLQPKKLIFCLLHVHLKKMLKIEQKKIACCQLNPNWIDGASK